MGTFVDTQKRREFVARILHLQQSSRENLKPKKMSADTEKRQKPATGWQIIHMS